MDNEKENDNSSNEEDLDSEEGTEDELPEEKPVKKERSEEDKLSYHERRAEQLRKKLGKESKPEPKSDEGTKSDDFTDGQYAILLAKGIEDEAELALVKEYIKNTGKPLMDVLRGKFFQNDLNELRDGKKSMDATPKGNKRSGASGGDEAGYWLEKIVSGQAKLSDIPNRDLRVKVVELRRAKESDNSPFK